MLYLSLSSEELMSYEKSVSYEESTVPEAWQTVLMRAIQITRFGGPEVLVPVDVPDPRPVDGHVLLDVDAAGVNFADTHQTENSYLSPQRLPLIPGSEVVGRTADGHRVVALLASGGYAQRALARPDSTFPVPDDVTDGQALALILQGLTAWHLLRTSARLAEGETVVVHAAAGGVGSLAVQLAKRFGAGRVIATASTAAKRELALSLGADAAIDVSTADLTAALITANDGRPVDVVLEMVGGAVTDASIDALAPFGRCVYFGTASRSPAAPIVPTQLMAHSRAVVGFWLAHCLAVPGMTREPMAELMTLVRAGELRPVLGGSYPLSEAAAAHRELRARRTTGKLTLDPSR
jgi:NADPH:quinone reductase